jgi:hypothetical protein
MKAEERRMNWIVTGAVGLWGSVAAMILLDYVGATDAQPFALFALLQWAVVLIGALISSWPRRKQ